MDNAALPYLSKIANALEKLTGGGSAKNQGDALAAIAKSINVSANSESVINTEGNANTKAIGEKLDKGLLTTEQVGSSAVVKSLLELLRTAVVSELHSRFSVTVTENNATVEKSLAQLINEQNTILSSMVTALSTMGQTISGINTNVSRIQSSIGNLISTDARDIMHRLGDIETSVGNAAIYAHTIEQDLSPSYESIDNISKKLKDIRTNTSGS